MILNKVVKQSIAQALNLLTRYTKGKQPQIS